jgi:hypothetical protein
MEVGDVWMDMRGLWTLTVSTDILYYSCNISTYNVHFYSKE